MTAQLNQVSAYHGDLVPLQTAATGLSQAGDVRLDAVLLLSAEASGTAVPGLDLIDDDGYARGARSGDQRSDPFGVEGDAAGLALDEFDDQPADLRPAVRGRPGIERLLRVDEDRRIVDEEALFVIVSPRHRHRAVSAAVEAILEGHHRFPARHFPCHLHGQVDRFATGVDEEHLLR